MYIYLIYIYIYIHISICYMMYTTCFVGDDKIAQNSHTYQPVQGNGIEVLFPKLSSFKQTWLIKVTPKKILPIFQW